MGALGDLEGRLQASLEALRASLERPWPACGVLWRPLDVPKASLKGPKEYRKAPETSQRVAEEAPLTPKRGRESVLKTAKPSKSMQIAAKTSMLINAPIANKRDPQSDPKRS